MDESTPKTPIRQCRDLQGFTNKLICNLLDSEKFAKTNLEGLFRVDSMDGIFSKWSIPSFHNSPPSSLLNGGELKTTII